jgi:hypothetical protein
MTNTTPETKVSNDPVNHPSHYTGHPSGIEAIQITEHMGFNLGNATKYIWRCDLKKDAIEDLKKARWYIDREIAKRENEAKATSEAKWTAGMWNSTKPEIDRSVDGPKSTIGTVYLNVVPQLDEAAVAKAVQNARRLGGI